MNSDYSSSTYHIYDQISDLIIIKQQRLERKRQQEHRRKVILVCLIATLLVSALLFLLLQSLYTTLNSSFNLIHKSSQPVPTMIQNEQPLLSSSLSPFISSQQQQQQQQNNNLFRRVSSSDTATSNGVLLRPWQTAPSGGAKTNELFDINRFQLLAASSSPEQLNHRFNHQQQQLPSAAEISQFDLSRQWQQSQSWQPDQLQQQFASRFQPQQPLQPQLILPDVIQRTSANQQQPPVHQQQQQQQHHHHHFATSPNEAVAVAAAAAASNHRQQQPVVPNSIHQQHQHHSHNINNNNNNNNNPQLAVQPLEASPATSAAAASNQSPAASHLPLPLSPPPPPPPKKPSVLRKQYACPNQCSGRGQCVKVSPSSQLEASQAQQQQQQLQEWRCQCQPGTTGDDCGYLLERQCDDGIDNDRDGLVDCADSECCSDKVCQNSTLCMKSPDPLDILNRKNPPPPTSSFFQRMQFLIEKFSSQIYSQPRDFNDSLLRLKYADRASVIRGKVTYMKQGVTGVRVSVAGQINLGITFTRDGGYFDLMVNGGGVLVIEFRREPFATLQKAVRVPWNEIVLMDSVELSLDSPYADLVMQPAVIMQQANEDSKLPVTGGVQKEHQQPSCLVHNYRIMRPYITAAPKSSPQRSQRSLNQNTNKLSSSQAVILRDSGTVKQSFLIPKSSPSTSSSSSDSDQHHHHQHLNQQDFDEQVSLVYISSKATDFMSTITLQLTPPLDESLFKLPTELKLIHLKIIIEGNLFEQLLEPSNNLSFTYAWNRRNVYRQKSFGLSTASVSVGYEYFDCKHIVWSTKHIQLPGYDLSISDIGSQWNLNIHHRYNHRDSILQRADGANFNLKTDKPRVVQPLMGDGYQRPANCPQCDNVGADSSGNQQLSEQRLLKPQALVSAPDGSLYIGDFNLIRRIEWSSTTAPKGTNSERIVRTVLELPPSRVPSRYNLAMNYADQKLYLSDPDRQQIYLIREHQGALNKQSGNDTNLDDSLLVPVVGSGIKCQQLEDRAANCGDGQAAELARLIEPKAVAFDLSSRMYIADGPNVRMVDTDGKIYTILGDYGNLIRHTKFPCSGEAIPMHKFVPRSPVDLAFSPIDDTLHILDDNVVYKITQDKRVQIVAGRLSHCLNQNNAQPQQPVDWPPRTSGSSNRQQQQQQQLRATEVFLQSAQSITFAQNGDLFISEDDQKQVISRVLLVVPDEDTISLYAGLPVDDKSQLASSQLMPTVDSVNLEGTGDANAQLADNNKQRTQQQQQQSNILPLAVNQVTPATDYKFNSVAAITVDQQGKLVIADKLQLRILSVEPDLPQINPAGEYELQSPDNSDELLIFNRHGHHIATREISSTNQQPPAAALTSALSSSQLPVASQQQQQQHHHRYHHHPKQQQQRTHNKYTFSYNVNTSLGQLTSVSYANGNKLSIYRDGSQSNVKMIETTFGAQCKLDISRSGQLNSIAVTSSSTSNKTNFTYQSGTGGLLKQSVDVILGEQYEFNYDEFGRAVSISHSSSSNSASRSTPPPVECRVSDSPTANLLRSTYLSQQCSALIVAEA